MHLAQFMQFLQLLFQKMCLEHWKTSVRISFALFCLLTFSSLHCDYCLASGLHHVVFVLHVLSMHHHFYMSSFYIFLDCLCIVGSFGSVIKLS